MPPIRNTIAINEYKTYYQEELNFSLTIDESCIDKISSYSRFFYPKEFGGVLLGGYSDDGKSIYITDLLVPEKFKNTHVFFKADDNSEINKKIKRIHEETHGNIMYLGDWHSHPNMSNHYSGVDFSSIEKQAASSKVSINNPILAIASIGRNDLKVGYYIYYDERLFKFTEK